MRQPLNVTHFLKIVAVFLLIGFVIRVGADYYQYREGLKALPFYYYVIGRTLLFIVPSTLCAAGAKYIERKSIS